MNNVQMWHAEKTINRDYLAHHLYNPEMKQLNIFYQIPFNNWFLSWCKDSLELWWPWGVLQTMCRWHTCLWTMCRWCVDDICHPPPKISQRSLTLMLSARHPHIVHTLSVCRLHVICMRLQLPDYFNLNTRGQLC